MDSKIKDMYYKNVPVKKARKLHYLSWANDIGVDLLAWGLTLCLIDAMCVIFGQTEMHYWVVGLFVIGLLVLICSYVGLWWADRKTDWIDRETGIINKCKHGDYLKKAKLYNACIEVIGNRQYIALDDLLSALPERAKKSIMDPLGGGKMDEIELRLCLKDMCRWGWFKCGDVIYNVGPAFNDVLCISKSAVKKFTITELEKFKGEYAEKEAELLEQNVFPETYGE